MRPATEPCDVVVVGGGVAGLGAACELARRGLSVVVLEARDRLGGRIHTLHRKGWGPMELGAEFIHGGSRATWRLIRASGIRTERAKPRHWFAHGGHVHRLEHVGRRIARVTGAIDRRRVGAESFADYLRDEAARLDPLDEILAAEFVGGFNAAPLDEIGARSVAGQTLEESEQHVLPGGQDALVAALASRARRAGARIEPESIVDGVTWRRGDVSVHVRARGSRVATTWPAAAVLLTLPLGVLQAAPPQPGAVRFDPPLRGKAAILRRARMGHAVRILLRFDGRGLRRILPREVRDASSGGFGFLHAPAEALPTWWSLRSASILTAWAAGPAAQALAGSRREVLRDAMTALGHVLDAPASRVRAALREWTWHDWSRDPFSRGAYSFSVAGLADGPERLRQPVADTIFLAGEATADPHELGTVHGALGSGMRAAAEIAACLRAGGSRARGRRSSRRRA